MSVQENKCIESTALPIREEPVRQEQGECPGAKRPAPAAATTSIPQHPKTLNLVLEVSGAPKRNKQAKASTARDLWVPAVNNTRSFGRWAYIETREARDAVRAIRKSLTTEGPKDSA